MATGEKKSNVKFWATANPLGYIDRRFEQVVMQVKNWPVNKQAYPVFMSLLFICSYLKQTRTENISYVHETHF